MSCNNYNSELIFEKFNIPMFLEYKFHDFINKGKPPCDYEKELIKNHHKRVLKILEGKIVPPYEVEIQPSSNCNLKCIHCFGSKLTNELIENKINLNEMRIIAERINDFKENGFKINIAKFCGTTGEPLVNPCCAFSIPYFKKFHKKVYLYTNGLLINHKTKQGNYIEYIKDIDKIVISLDSATKETFFKLKGINGFSKIIENIKKLNKIKNPSLKIQLSFVIGEKNYFEIVKAAELAKQLGVDELIYRVDFTDLNTINKLSEQIIKNIKDSYKYEDNNFKVISTYSEKDICVDDRAFNSNNRICFNQHLWACIGPDANMYACGHRTYKGIKSYGSIIENSFKKLWLSKIRSENLNNLPDEKCKYCSPSSARRNTFMTFLKKVKSKDYTNIY